MTTKMKEHELATALTYMERLRTMRRQTARVGSRASIPRTHRVEAEKNADALQWVLREIEKAHPVLKAGE